MSSYTLRRARPPDVDTCILLRGRTRENAISVHDLARRGITAESWRADTMSGRLPGYVACAGRVIVGYCFGDRDTGEIVVLAILPAHEDRGLGRSLLARMTDHLVGLGHRRLHLMAAADAGLRAHGFYRHLGWQPVGRQAENGDEELELFVADA